MENKNHWQFANISLFTYMVLLILNCNLTFRSSYTISMQSMKKWLFCAFRLKLFWQYHSWTCVIQFCKLVWTSSAVYHCKTIQHHQHTGYKCHSQPIDLCHSQNNNEFKFGPNTDPCGIPTFRNFTSEWLLCLATWERPER